MTLNIFSLAFVQLVLMSRQPALAQMPALRGIIVNIDNFNVPQGSNSINVNNENSNSNSSPDNANANNTNNVPEGSNCAPQG